MTRHDWTGKLINRKMCKRLKFGHDYKWYMHKPQSVQENKIHEILLGLLDTNDHLNPARRSDLVLINKKKRTNQLVDFAIPADRKVKRWTNTCKFTQPLTIKCAHVNNCSYPTVPLILNNIAMVTADVTHMPISRLKLTILQWSKPSLHTVSVVN